MYSDEFLLAFNLRTFVNALSEFLALLSDCSVQNVGDISQIHSIDLGYKEYSYKDDGKRWEARGKKYHIRGLKLYCTPCMAA